MISMSSPATRPFDRFVFRVLRMEKKKIEYSRFSAFKK